MNQLNLSSGTLIKFKNETCRILLIKQKSIRINFFKNELTNDKIMIQNMTTKDVEWISYHDWVLDGGYVFPVDKT